MLAFAARRLEAEPVALPARPPPRPSLRHGARARAHGAGAAGDAPAQLRGDATAPVRASSASACRGTCCAGCSSPRSATRCSRWRWAARSPSRGLPAAGDDVPVPDAVDDLLGTRVAELPRRVRRVLLALALQRRPAGASAHGDLGAGCDRGGGRRRRRPPGRRPRAAVAPAPGRGREEAGARPGAARAPSRARDSGRRRGVARTPSGARHEAPGRGSGRDGCSRGRGGVGARCRPRGGRPGRARAAPHAAGLARSAADGCSTSPATSRWPGERQRVTDLLTPEIDSLPRQAPRARLAAAVRGRCDHEHLRQRGVSRPRAGRRATTIPRSAPTCSRRRPARSPPPCRADPRGRGVGAGGPGRRARIGPVLQRLALHGLGWARALRGLPIDEVCERFRAASDAAFHITDSPDPVAGLRLLWRGHVDEARIVLTQFLTLADARGEEVSYALQRMQVCDLELRTGGWEAAARLARRVGVRRPAAPRSRPRTSAPGRLLAAGRGLPDEAERWAAQAIAGAEPGGYNWQLLEARRARGIAALLAREPARAVESLGAVWEHLEREGVDEPGAFPVAPDLVEALVEVGELEEARSRARPAARPGAAAGASLGARERTAVRRAASARVRGVRRGGDDRSPGRGRGLRHARPALRSRPLAPQPGARAAPATEMGHGAHDARDGRRSIRRARLAGLGRGRRAWSSRGSAAADRARPTS